MEKIDKNKINEELNFQRKRALKIDIIPAPDYVIKRYKEHKLWRLFPREFVFKRLGKLEGKKILDFGCGEGALSVLLAKLGGNVTGLDISPELIDLAKKRAKINGVQNTSDFLVGDILEDPLKESKFDFVVCNCVLHHVDLYKVLPLLLDCLEPDGKIIILEPMAFSPLLQKFRDILPLEKDTSPGERQLDENDLDFIKKSLVNIELRYSDLFGRLSRLFPNQHKIDRGHPFTKIALILLHGFDRILITLFPSLSKLYGFFVIIGEVKS